MSGMTSFAAVSVVTHDMAAAIDFYSRLGLHLASAAQPTTTLRSTARACGSCLTPRP